MNTIFRYLSEIDIFGVSLTLKILKREKYKSIFGSSLTIFLLVYLLYKLAILIINSINKQNFTQVNNLYIEDNQVSLESYEFFICNSKGFADYNFLKTSEYLTVIDVDNKFEISECEYADLNSLRKTTNTPPMISMYEKYCICGKMKENIILFSDLLKTNVNLYTIKIFAKPKFLEFDYKASSIFFVNRNTYFDYSKKDSPINSFLSPILIFPRLISSTFTIFFNKIKYSEIIDLDIFYKKSTEYEDYTLSDKIEREGGDVIKESEISQKPIISIFMQAENKIYKYDITLVSIDNILATFSGVFQILSMILGFIGQIYNNIFFNFQMQKSFFKHNGNNKIYEYLNEIHQRQFLTINKKSKIIKEESIKCVKFKEIDNDKLLLNDNAFIKQIDLDFKLKEDVRESQIIDNAINFPEYDKAINDLSLNINDIDSNLNRISESNEEKQNPENESERTNNLDNLFDINRQNKLISKKNNYIEINNKESDNNQYFYNIEKKPTIPNNEIIINNINSEILSQKNLIKLSKKIFDNYVCSYEFLFDIFSQMEFLKVLMLDENLVYNFNEISRLYITMGQIDSVNSINEIKQRINYVSNFSNKEDLFPKEKKISILETTLKVKIENFLASIG